MGFDLFGRYPVSDAGGYFRMNQFTWLPFVDLLHDLCDRKILCKCHHWYSSDGDGLAEKDALALAKNLLARIEDGSVQRALEQGDYTFASYQARAKKRGGRFAEYARGNLKAIEEARAEAERMAAGSDGKLREYSDLPVLVEHAEQFAEFLKDSGGFRIC
jgi:hypothetical protein